MTPLQPGDALPPLSLHTQDGQPFDQESISGTPTVFYFMRSATCGICLGHVQRLAKKLERAEQNAHVFVIVPEGLAEAEQVAQRVAFPVLAGTGAHEAVGLGRRVFGAVQGSGTLLVDREGRVAHFKHGTLQTQAYDEAGLFRALGNLQG